MADQHADYVRTYLVRIEVEVDVLRPLEDIDPDVLTEREYWEVRFAEGGPPVGIVNVEVIDRLDYRDADV